MRTQEHGDAQTIGVLIPPGFVFPPASLRGKIIIFFMLPPQQRVVF